MQELGLIPGSSFSQGKTILQRQKSALRRREVGCSKSRQSGWDPEPPFTLDLKERNINSPRRKLFCVEMHSLLFELRSKLSDLALRLK